MNIFTKLSFVLLLLFVAFSFQGVQAQGTITVKGKVIDETSREPIEGASVYLIGGSTSTSTDGTGSFSLSGIPKNSKLRISFIGYSSAEAIAKEEEMTISLKPTTNTLEDVVVIGYGSVKRKDVTTAISSISLDDLNERPVVSAMQAVQGRAAGVTVSQPNGAPGGGTSIRIRGTTSFNGSNNPLYVVDNIPVDNINFLAPTDIEDMQILKDASSAAIYGTRAANGVVLITTKKGKSGNPKITFNMLATKNKVTNPLEPLNYQQYKELQDEIGILSLPDGLSDKTDWFKETINDGVIQNYQASVSDGSEKLSYLLSGGYVNDKGIINSAFYKRYNFRANLENKVRDWLTISANVSYSDESGNGIIQGTGSNRGGVIMAALNTPTFAPIWDELNPKQYYTNFYGLNITSPLENIARTQYNKNRENRLLAAGTGTIHILPELNFRSTFALDRRNAMYTSFLDPLTTSWGRNQYGEATDTRNMNTVITFDNVFNYNKSFGQHSLEAMFGTSYTSSEYTNSWINGSHFRDGNIQTLNAANKIAWEGTGSGASEWALMSYFSRLSYNYDGKYILTANVRADGSSKLHPDSRWGVFPSFSAAWRISSEDFLKDVSWINDLKIRGGWGMTGNQDGISDYAYLERYAIRRIAWFEEGNQNALPTINFANLPTRDLHWENTSQTGLGIDFSGFNQRLIVNLDLYQKTTRDMLMYISLPEGQRANTMIRNEGEMSNKGIELNLQSKNMINDFKWNTSFNISFNRNKLVSLDLQQIYPEARTVDVVNDYAVRNEPGRPMGSFFGYISDGVNPETGELIYRDINQDGKVSSTDRTYIGDPNPNFTFGLTNDFSYKNFNLSVFIQGTQGNDIFNASRMDSEGMYDGKNQTTRVLQRWRVPGQHTEVPKASFNMLNSTYFIEDGSYLRVKNVSLSYNVKGAFLNRLGINRLQPFISATNLFTLTKYKGMDPEVNQYGNSSTVQGVDWGTYPQSKSYVVGLNLEF